MSQLNTKYRPEIDGLRTIAVVPVILFHLGSNLFSGGYYGVDVFFVISGYLITKLISNSILNDNFSMYQFWIRRIKRLLPLLLFVVITTLVFVSLFVFKPSVKNTAIDAIPAIFSYSNFHALFNFKDYWGSAADSSYFLHTWSLSVEEQFYLLFPLFLFFSYKYFGQFFKPLILLTILSFILFFILVQTNKNIAFFMLPTRVWELSAGGLLSLYSFKKDNIKSSKWLPALGIVLIFSSFVFAKEKIGLEVILSVIGTLMVIGFTTINGFVGKILANKFMVFFGKLSYSMYLWHWPIIVFRKDISYGLRFYDSIYVDLFCFLITIILSIFSFYLIENKTRHYKNTPKIVLAGIIFVFIGFLFFNSTLFSLKYNSKFQVTSYVEKFDVTPSIPNRKERIFGITIPKRKSKDSKAYSSGIVKIFNNKSPEIILMGDSHGVMWTGLFDEMCSNLNVSYSFYTMNGITPFFDLRNIKSISYKGAFPQEKRIIYAENLIENINKWKPKLIFIALKWDGIFSEDLTKSEHFIQFLNYVTEKKIKVVLLSQPPIIPFIGDHNTNQFLTYLNISPSSKNHFFPYIYEKNRAYSEEKLKKLSNNNVKIFWTNHQLIKNNKMLITIKNKLLYFDDDHLSYEGTKIFSADLSKIIFSNCK